MKAVTRVPRSFKIALSWVGAVGGFFLTFKLLELVPESVTIPAGYLGVLVICLAGAIFSRYICMKLLRLDSARSEVSFMAIGAIILVAVLIYFLASIPYF